MANLTDILTYLRDIAPINSALPNDPVGLLIGSENNSAVTKIGVCLDATLEAAKNAISEGAQLLVAHHPLIYRPLKRIDTENDPISAVVSALVKSDVSLFAMHTNWDRAQFGINDTLASLLELEDTKPMGSDGIEALVRIGNLRTPCPLSEFEEFVSSMLNCSGTSKLRTNAIDPTRLITRVAVCGGAGGELAAQAQASGADAYVTSDVRHNEFLDATARDFALLDAGHYATEAPGMRALIPMLTAKFPGVSVVWAE